MLHDLSCTKTSQSYTLFYTYGEKNLISYGGIVKGAWGLDLQNDFKILSQIYKHSWHLQRDWIHKEHLGSAFQQLTPTRTHGAVSGASHGAEEELHNEENSWMSLRWEEFRASSFSQCLEHYRPTSPWVLTNKWQSPVPHGKGCHKHTDNSPTGTMAGKSTKIHFNLWFSLERPKEEFYALLKSKGSSELISLEPSTQTCSWWNPPSASYVYQCLQIHLLHGQLTIFPNLMNQVWKLPR